jgi:23S rRNA (guanosine2251-2'-O)-methyltransferase
MSRERPKKSRGGGRASERSHGKSSTHSKQGPKGASQKPKGAGGSKKTSSGTKKSTHNSQRTVVRGQDRSSNKKRGADTGLGGTQIEGRQAVRELLRAGKRKVHELLLAERMEETAVLAEIIDLAGDMRVSVREVSDLKLMNEARTEAPQGVVAFADPVEEVPLDSLMASDPVPFLLVLDGLTDPGNLGAILRTAEGAGVTGIVLPRHRSVRLSPTAVKAAAGAVEYLPIAHVGGIPTALSDLKDAGIWCIGLAGDASDQLFDIKVANEPIALVLGAEGKGISRLAQKRCDQLVSIPLTGALESLNVSVAAAVASYEIVRRRGLAKVAE